MTAPRLADRAYADIARIVIDGDLQIGDRLPSETQLAAQLGVSRTVVREALVRLEADGVTEARRGAGSFVTRRPSALIARHMAIEELPVALATYEVRFVLEAEAARLAAQRRSDTQMHAIGSAMAALRDALLSGAQADAEDMALHRAIMQASGNAAFVQAFDTLNDGIRQVMTAGIDISRTHPDGPIAAMVMEHENIVDAIRAHDGERAALAMHWHLSQGRRRLMP